MIHKYTTVILCNMYTTVTKRKAPATLAGAAGLSLHIQAIKPVCVAVGNGVALRHSVQTKKRVFEIATSETISG